MDYLKYYESFMKVYFLEEVSNFNFVYLVG